jgi:phospholipid/cholesterol/gamma-HCH transport system substrate-binding protein
MITTTTKVQLLLFAIITVLGAAFVGGRYAEIDRLVIDRTYPVKVDFTESGGIFAGAEVTYRGLPVGKVKSLEFTPAGVRATLDIEKNAPKVPSDLLVVVANKSAIGEQYVDLQPRRSGAPYLDASSHISSANTKVPLDTTRLLLDVGKLTSSVDVKSLQTLINEVGLAFAGYGKDLSTIIDTFTSFLEAANQNFPETQALIRGSSSVLETLVDKRGQFASLTDDLTKLTSTLVDEDENVRDLVGDGPGAEKLIGAVLKENTADLTSLFQSLEEVSAVGDKRWKSLELISIILPYLVDGGFSTMQESKTRPGKSNTSIGLVFVSPLDGYQAQICATKFGDPGYRARRLPNDLTTLPLKHYDCLNEGKVTMNPHKTLYNFNRSVAAPADGKDSWKWLLMGMTTN